MILLNKIQDMLAFEISVKFSREINQFRITLCKEGHESQTVVLPFDHLSEKRICDYIDLMATKLKETKELDTNVRELVVEILGDCKLDADDIEEADSEFIGYISDKIIKWHQDKI